ncbi:hypothetical protein Taro_001505 [Colocasia esculenta]|uniref:Uncharacterized protein n=1 Tax=Colocasia esculenta TaxID=4460 RepID=A0A843TER3_COLES|nr:hypothetical protein [Colocasia esculenta]
MLPERNLGAGPEIFECDLVSIGSKCRFRIGASQAVPISGRTKIYVLPKGPNLCGCPASDLRNRGRRYCQKTLETG